MKLLEKQVKRKKENENITWLVFRKGYSSKQLNIMANWCYQRGIAFFIVDSSMEIVQYINTNEIKRNANPLLLSEKRKLNLIKSVYNFSHGELQIISFGYGNDDVYSIYAFDRKMVEKINKNAFFSNAFWYSYACRTGAGIDIEYMYNAIVHGKKKMYDYTPKDSEPQNSLAQFIANTVEIKVYAYQSRTNYENILGSVFERHLKNGLGLLTDRDVNGNDWYKNLGAINMPVKDNTPYWVPGLTLFEKGKKPKVIERFNSGMIGGNIPHREFIEN